MGGRQLLRATARPRRPGRARGRTVVGAEQNIGFGRAVNLVAARTEDEWLLAATRMSRCARGARAMMRAGADPRVGGASHHGSLLPDRRNRALRASAPDVTARRCCSTWGCTVSAPELGDRLCLEGFWDADRARPVPWAIGACLLIRRGLSSSWADSTTDSGSTRRTWTSAGDCTSTGGSRGYEPGAQAVHCSGSRNFTRVRRRPPEPLHGRNLLDDQAPAGGYTHVDHRFAQHRRGRRPSGMDDATRDHLASLAATA